MTKLHRRLVAIIASIGPAAPSGRPFWQARMSSSLAMRRRMSVTSQTRGQIRPVRKPVIAARTMTLMLAKTTAAVRCRKVALRSVLISSD
jgi:hypothetical protein